MSGSLLHLAHHDGRVEHVELSGPNWEYWSGRVAHMWAHYHEECTDRLQELENRSPAQAPVWGYEYRKPKKVFTPKPEKEKRVYLFPVPDPSAFSSGQTITLLVSTNPKRAGSASYDRFALYTNGMTVSEALRAGVTRADLIWDSQRGFISIS